MLHILSGGWPYIFATAWSLALTAALSAIFWVLRNALGSDRSSGTELFALLVAVDLSVLCMTVDLTGLAGHRLTDPESQRAFAVIMMVATIILAVPCIVFDRLAEGAWVAVHSAHSARNVDRRHIYAVQYAQLLFRAAMIRWLVAAAHLWWIIRVPRWAAIHGVVP